METEYLKWVKDLYRDFHLLPEGSPCHKLTSSCVETPIDLLSQHIQHGLSRSHLEPPDPWFNKHLTSEIADIQSMSSESILLTIGASQAISLVCMALIQKDDHVIIERPCYQPLMAVPQYLGADIQYLHRNTEDGFGIRPQALEALTTERTKLIILTNLHNPSGAFLAVDELTALYKIAQKHNPDVKILVDEVYLRFISPHMPSASTLGEGFITINSLSKVYGLWTLRCGWIAAHPAIIDRVKDVFVLIENVGAPMNESVSSIVFEHLDAYAGLSAKAVNQNREIIHNALDNLFADGTLLGQIPDQGCILFPGFTNTENADPLVNYLAKEHGVYVVPGRFFGMPGRVRMGFGGETDAFKTSINAFAHGIREYFQPTNNISIGR